VQITRDSPTASHAALHVRDTNSQPGRTQALLLVEDANDGTGPIATLVKTGAGALGAEVRLYQDSSSPAAADVVGRLSFQGEDDGSTQREYARIDGMIYNPAAATPNGRVSVYARGGASGGSMTETFRTYSDQFGNVISGTSRFYTSYLYGGGLTFYGDNQGLTISSGHLVTDSVLAVHSGSFAPTSGTARGWSHATSFAPTSGNAAFVSRDEGLTINQTGGANGDVTALRVSVTETAVGGAAYLADLRAGAAGTSRRLAVTTAGDLTLRSDSAGTLGPTVTLLHDSASPAASDELSRLVFQGRDSAANLTEYGRLSAVLVDPTNTSEDGELRLHAMGGGTLRQALALRSPTGEAQLLNGLAAGSTPAFRLTATSEYSSSQPVFRVEDNNGSDLLLTIRGDGTTEIGAGEASPGSASGHLLAFKKHTAFSGSESKATTGVQTTTTATQTTLWSFTLADNTVYWFEAKVAARRTSGGATADRAGYRLFCCVYRKGGGGATLQGTVLQDARESVAAWDATLTVSGNDVRLSVTGEASRTIQWAATIAWQGVSTS